MSVKLDKRNTTIDSQILKGNISPSKVYQPQWINNQTRLNQTNVELMRSNLIKYIDLVAGSLFTNIKNDINSIIDKSAGWVQLNTANDDIVGEIFNDYDNNKVAPNKKYQATFGTYTEANGNGQFVCGNANEVVENALFIVGCGNFDYQITDDSTPQDGVTYYTLDNGIYKKFEGTNFKEGTYYYELVIDKQNALVINDDGTLEILKDITFDGNAFNGTVRFKDRIIFEQGFDATGDSSVDGKLEVTKVPTLTTHVVRKKELDDLRREISGALHYIGKTTTTLNNGDTTNPIPIYDAESGKTENIIAVAGDVVIINGTQNEFIFDGSSWTDYSAYGNYVLTKTYEDEQEKLTRALFSNGEVPQWSDTNSNVNFKSLQTQLQTKISQETTNRNNSDKYITGLSTVPTSGTYNDSNTKLRSDLTKETTNRNTVTTNISGLATVPNNYENSNEKLRLRIDDINTVLGSLADKYVIAKEPSMTLTAGTIKSQEIGTVITPSYSTTFDSGAYEYEPTETGVTVTKYNVTFNNETKTTASGSFKQLTVDSTSKVLKAEITYSNGNIPKNNLGLDYADGKIIGKTISKSLTLSGYRQGCFYGTVTTADMTVDKITSSLIRGLTKSNKAYTKGNITLTVPVGATAILIACPKTNTGPTNVINTTVNAPMTDLYGTSKIIKTLTVAGAGSDAGIEYNVWMYKPNSAYESTANLTITLG